MLTRRHALLTLLAAGAAGAMMRPALALELVDYSPDALSRLQGSGKPFLIDFFATWCSTCAAQERVLEQLAAENGVYGAIPILRVDWDKFGNGELAQQLAIPRRSTLVMMQGTRELGRLVAETRKARIAGLLDLAAS
jgi:thioredoxin 1